MDLDWLIVGGGPHGVHLAVRLLGEAGVAAERMRIVDPAEHLLERWKTCTALTGMRYLRSSSVHHLDIEPLSLRHFGGGRRNRKPGQYAAPHSRPALELFNRHCDHVIETFGLDALHVRDRASTGAVSADGVLVGLESTETLMARNLVLAIGNSERPSRPDWAPVDHPRVQHVFEREFDGWPTTPERVVVLGGGISAGQIALRLCREGHQVRLVTRHPLRQHQFDSDPGWLGPKYMTGFQREANLERRRELIDSARHRGSVPPGVRRDLRLAINRGELRHHEGMVQYAEASEDEVTLHLADGGVFVADRILLATGFEAGRPGCAFVDGLIEAAQLPCARCGYPIVDAALRWHERVYVSGPLAELELGPSARNLVGARRAGDRIMRSIADRHADPGASGLKARAAAF